MNTILWDPSYLTLLPLIIGTVAVLGVKSGPPRKIKRKERIRKLEISEKDLRNMETLHTYEVETAIYDLKMRGFKVEHTHPMSVIYYELMDQLVDESIKTLEHTEAFDEKHVQVIEDMTKKIGVLREQALKMRKMEVEV